MKVTCFLLVNFLMGAMHTDANVQQVETGLQEDEQHYMGKRYGESSITSEMSKIMDSMAQKHFVDLLLNHRDKRSRPTHEEKDPEFWLCNKLQKVDLHEKQKTNI